MLAIELHINVAEMLDFGISFPCNQSFGEVVALL